MTEPLPIWVYWEGECPPFIELCWQTILRHNPHAKRVCPATVAVLGGQSILDAATGLPRTIRSDLVRAWLLYQFGGVWLDADTIAMARLDWQPELYDLIAVRSPTGRQLRHRGLVATPWGCRAGSPIAGALLEAVQAAVTRQRRGQRVPYGYTSTGLLSEIAARHRDAFGKSIRIHAHWRYCPVDWSQARRVYLADRVNRILAKPTILLHHLTNPIPKAFAGKSVAEVLSDNKAACGLLRRSLRSNSPVPRTAAILRHLPDNRPLIGAEIGVFQGRNANELLRCRPHLRLILVDPWADIADDTYRRTADVQAKFSASRWARIYQDTMRRLSWATGRIQCLRLCSAQAAQHVEDRSLDFVFVDANHSRESVTTDLATWLPKIRTGGWIGGHDYHHPRERQRGYGVTAAVDQFAAARDLTVTTGADTTWFASVP